MDNLNLSFSATDSARNKTAKQISGNSSSDAKNTFLRTVLTSVLLLPALLMSLSSPVFAKEEKKENGFAQTMNGPSVKPLSQREDRDPSGNDTFYQDCQIRIDGKVVGRNTAAITDADGKHNIDGLYRTFVHDAGKKGKFTLILKVRPDPGQVDFAPPARFQEEPVTEAVLKAYPDISEFVRDTNGNLKPNYKIQSVSTDVIPGLSDPALVVKFEGSGIYKNVNRLFVRCTFLIDTSTQPNDLIRCVHCFFFFGK